MTKVEKGKPLSNEGLFRLVCDEVFLDGVVEDFENRILQVLAKFLGLESSRALSIAESSKKAFEGGELGEEDERRPLSPALLYEKALYFVCSDGEIDEEEGRMLEGLRKLFRISDELHEDVLEKVQGEFIALDEEASERMVSDVSSQLMEDLEQKEWNKVVKGFREYRRLGRRLAVSHRVNSYLDALVKLIEASAKVSDPFNRQKNLDRAFRILEAFGENCLRNAQAKNSSSFVEACRRALFTFIALRDLISADRLLARQLSQLERFAPDENLERAVTALTNDYMRLVLEGGDDDEEKVRAGSELCRVLALLREKYPSSDGVERLFNRYKELTGQDFPG